MLRFHAVVFGILFLMGSSPARASQEVPQSFTLDGRLYSDATAGTPLLGTGTLKIQILDSAQTCALYEESQSYDTTLTDGAFNIQVGEATSPISKRTAGDSGHSLSDVFLNDGSLITGKLVSNGAACTGNATAGFQRYVRITVTPTAGAARVLSPNLPLTSIPSAMVAENAQSLSGKTASQFVGINTTSPAVLSQSNLENIFSTTNYPKLTDLLAGNSTSYVKAMTNNSIQIPSSGSTPSTPAAGQMWYESGVLKYWDGSAAQVVGSGGGSGMTSVTAGTGLSGGTISTTGTIELATSTLNGLWSGDGTNVWRASGNVGIGTATPGALLAIEKNTDALVDSGIYNPSTGANAVASWYVQASNAVGGLEAYSNAFVASGAKRPNGIFFDATGDGGLSVGASHASGALRFYSGGSADANQRVTILPNGNVGIGTNNPAMPFQVAGYTWLTSTDYVLGSTGTVMGMGPSGAYGMIAVATNGQTTPGPLALQPFQGNVGVGTTSPGVSLDVGNRTDAIALPSGATAQRPSSPVNGYTRYNTDLKGIEAYVNGGWHQIASGVSPTAGQDGMSLRWNNTTKQFDWFTAGAAGSGIGTLNGLTATSQNFAIGTGGLAPNFDSQTSTHTLHIPMANTASVTAGLISKTEYDTFNNKLGTGTSLSGDVSGTYNNTSVDKIKGKAVTAAPTLDGQVLRYNGTSFAPAFISMFDLRSTVTGSAAFGGVGCLSNQTLTWTAATDNLACSNISLPVGQVTGVLPVANGGTGTNSLSGAFLINGGQNGAVTAGTNDANDLTLKTNGLARMTVTSGGNVGIGTASPSGNIEIYSASSAPSLRLSYNSTTSYAQIYESSANQMKVYQYSASGSPLMDFNPIAVDGTSSAYLRAFRDTNTTGNSGLQLFHGDGTGSVDTQLSIRGANSYINANGGYVGIGTATPTNPLTVNGRIETREGLLFNQGSGAMDNLIYLDSMSSGKVDASLGFFAAGVGGDDATDGPYFLARGNDFSALANQRGNMYFVAGSPTTPGANEGSVIFMTGMDLERMRIDSTGKVGIGTATPTATLDVYGTIKATGFSGPMSPTSMSVGAGTNGAPSMTFTGDTDTGFYDTSSNNTISVGVGGAKIFDFTSAGLVSPTAGGASVATGLGTTGAPTFSFAGDTDTGWWHPATNTLAASTGGSERMRIDSAGSVGIGTAAPSAVLDVESSTVASLRVGSGAASAGVIDMYQGTNYWRERHYESGSATSPNALAFGYNQTNPSMLSITSAGSVGIGTTAPSQKLDVDGNVRIGTTAASNANLLIDRPVGQSGFIKYQTAGSNRWDLSVTSTSESGSNAGSNFVIDRYDDSGTFIDRPLTILRSSGSVGIGTMTPQAMLDVNGTLKTKAIIFEPISAERFYPSVVAYNSGAISTGAVIVHSPISRATNTMFRIRVHGYGYGASTVIDSMIVGYTYSGVNGSVDGVAGAILNYSLVDNGNDGLPKSVGIDAAGKVAVSIGDTALSAYLYRVYVDTWISSSTDYSTGWSVDRTTTAGFGWLDYKVPTTSIVRAVNGNVGIGTATPTATLDVNGTIKATSFSGPMNPTSMNVGTGTNGAPSMSFSGDTDTGFYDTSSNNTISVGVGGAKVFDFTSTGLVSPTSGGASVATGLGTTGAPTFSFAGDTDTGWWHPAADTLAASTGGTERMRIDSNGNVGIGTTTSVDRLDVSAGLGYGIRVGDSSDSNNARIGLRTSSPGGHGLLELFDASEVKQVDLRSSGSSYFNGGNIGIGTTAPVSLGDGATPMILHVHGSNATNGYGLLNLSSSLTTNGSAVGAVTFGTAGTAGTDKRAGEIVGLLDAASGTNVSGRLAFYTNNAGTSGERMRISSNGSLGIGTTSSTAKVAIARGSSPTSVTIANEYLHLGGNYQTVNGLHLIGFGYTSPETYPNAYMGFQETSATGSGKGDLVFGARNVTTDSAPSEMMRITGAGNVGIGTTAPYSWAKLDVRNTGTAATAWTSGIYASAINSGSSASTNGNAAFNGYAYTSSAGGGFAYTRLLSGSAETANDGNPQSAYGAYIELETHPSDSGYGVLIANRSGGTSTGGTQYGVYLDMTDTDVTNYGIYQNSANNNYFAGHVGIGTAGPDSTLTISENTSGLPAPGANASGTILHIAGTDTASNTARVLIDAFGTGSQANLTLRASRGTAASPSALQLNDSIGGIAAKGYGASAYGPTAGAISFTSTENWTNSANGTKMVFWTTPNGSTTSATAMTIDQNGSVGIGTTSPSYKLHVNGSVAGVGAYNALSDRRFKTDIREIENPLGQVLGLRGVHFNWRKDEYPQYNFGRREDVGVIAQEVEKVVPEAVTTGEDGIKTVAYGKLIAPVIEAIKELYEKWLSDHKKIEEQARQIEEMKQWICEKDPSAKVCRSAGP